jgi:hypothetical protein
MARTSQKQTWALSLDSLTLVCEIIAEPATFPSLLQFGPFEMGRKRVRYRGEEGRVARLVEIG